MRRFFILVHDQARFNAKKAIDDSPEGYAVEIKPLNRSLAQNRMIHSIFSDLSKQCEWMGQKFSAEVWKRLCVASWLREHNQQPLLIPALDGHGVDIIYEKTSKLSVTECRELIEWCFAFGAENGIEFTHGDLENYLN